MTAARISHSWLDSDFSYAPAAPSGVIVTDEGRAMSLAAWRIESTAVPSETPSAVSKPTVVAGYCATCVTCSGDCTVRMVANADSGADSPLVVSTRRSPMDAGVRAWSGRASRITRYWLVSVKIVDTMRWP